MNKTIFHSLVLIPAILFIMVNCVRIHCSDKIDPVPQSSSSKEIVGWTNTNSGSISSNLIRQYFTDDKTGYVCGDGGFIYKTTDGYNTTTLLNSGTTANLRGIWFTDANTGFVVGAGATILKTINAGASWTPISAPTSATLNEVHFWDANNGIITGGGGVLLKTTDGGVNWVNMNSGTSVDLHGIYYKDINNIFICGQVYTMITTSNGGSTWSTVNTGLTTGSVVTPMGNIFFTDPNTGYAVGGYNYPSGTPSDAVIIKTTDGGVTWVQQANPAGTAYLSDVMFIDQNIGYVIGGDIPTNTSIVLKTTDGGANWIIQPTSNFRLVDLVLNSTGEGYAVGLNGAILKGNL